MIRRKSLFKLGIALLLGATSYVCAQSPDVPVADRADRDSLREPIQRVAHRTEEPEKKVAEHPLEPALVIARKCLANIEANIKDYSATLVKRERIGDKLGETEFMFVKIRHQPFSVYTYFKAPENLKGQEALYAQGKNEDGNGGYFMLAHGVGIKKLVGTVRLKPDGAMAMQGQRYPITEIGILNLTKRLIEVAEQDKQFGECEVKFYKGAKLVMDSGKRSCLCIQVIHPTPRPHFRFHMARVYVDDELNIPVRYEAYEWPSTPGGRPPLLEEYTYKDLKIDNGFTDTDFDEHNPSYGFP